LQNGGTTQGLWQLLWVLQHCILRRGAFVFVEEDDEDILDVEALVMCVFWRSSRVSQVLNAHRLTFLQETHSKAPAREGVKKGELFRDGTGLRVSRYTRWQSLHPAPSGGRGNPRMGSGGPSAWLRCCARRTLARMAIMSPDSSTSAIAEPARFHEAAHECPDDDHDGPGGVGVDAVACADDETLRVASTPVASWARQASDSPGAGS